MIEFYKLAEMIFKRMPSGWTAEVNTEFFTVFGDAGCQLIIFNPDGERVDDVVYHAFSHGYEEGLLESYVAGDCNGYETAEEILTKWAEMFGW